MLQNKLFSKMIENNHIIYRILGIKFSVKNSKFYKQFKDAIKIQDAYDLTELKNTKKLILFLIPSPDSAMINGGIMSIFSLCEESRRINNDALCIISTPPHCKYTYAKNDKFLNNENIYRFSQVVDNANNLDEMILHIPEYSAGNFYNTLSEKDIEFLKSIKNLHINIMNQNIELMPEPEKLKDLYKLTNNITQTLAHDRYATQEVCDKWQIPTHLFSVNCDMSKYKAYSFDEKEKIIVLSPDWNEHKERIIEKLEKELPDWKLITVNNMTFTEYMDLISRAFFTITFGEGFDGYYLQPPVVESIGFAVYNNEFFPSENWLKFDNVFKSYDEMHENIVGIIKQLQSDRESYLSLSKQVKTKHDKLYSYEKFHSNLKRFYNKDYDFVPVQNAKIQK